MRAAWYEQLGAAKTVLTIGEFDLPELGAEQVRIKIFASGVNPSDVKQRIGWGGLKMRFPRVIPHNDGSGVMVEVEEGVSRDRHHDLFASGSVEASDCRTISARSHC